MATADSLAGTQALRTSQFELGLALTLFTWPALTLAVQENWGGPDSAAKREWFAGAVAELFPAEGAAPSPASAGAARNAGPATQHIPDVEDVEDRLLQVMEDEFEVVVEDGSCEQIAIRILRLWEQCRRGEFGEVERMRGEWEARGGGKGRLKIERGGEGSEEESGDEEEEDEDGDGDGDVEMGGVERGDRRKVEPVIDEEGFETVVRRKGRGK